MNIFFGSIRKQLIVGISVVHAVLMIFFVFDLVARQRDFIRTELVKLTNGLALVLANNSETWLLSRDYSGLQEVVSVQQKYPNLRMAMVFAMDGKILAHTDPTKIGFFVGTKEKSNQLTAGKNEIMTSVGPESISAIAPIVADGETIGKAWVIMSQQAVLESLGQVAGDGILYTIVAILIGGVFALIVVKAMTMRLQKLMSVAEATRLGERNLRVRLHSQDELGQLGYAFDSMLDSLEQKEKSLELANQNANAANKAKSEFLANMSHEIRTPINAMIGMADVLADTELSPDQKKFVGIFQRAGENLITLINDILDFSKIEAGELKIVKTSFAIAELLDDVKKINEENASRKHLTLKFVVGETVPLIVWGDVNRIRQVLMNLISNAIKFSDGGVIDVAVQNKAQTGKSVSLEFSVRDSGIGIAPEHLSKLFERFRQVDSSTTRKVRGTGLGLAISKRLVELLGGSIHAESELGKGSRFFFRLSLDLEGISSAISPPMSTTEGVGGGFGKVIGPIKKILLVDDAEDNRILIHALLKEQPYEITECDNGLGALKIFTENQFDLILLDLQMPILDGYETARLMREWESEHHKPRTKIFALSADTIPELVEKAINAGCDSHIAKPIRKKV